MVKKNVDILAIGVHPDDIELACSGTLLRHIELGYSVGLLDLTRGELGTRGSASLRTEEAMDSLEKMKASFRIQLEMEDGFFEHTESNIRDIIKIIRYAQPSIVIANAIHDRHPDHGRAAKLIADACFYSGLAKIITEYEGIAQLPWRPNAIYHMIQDYQIKPDIIVDISNFMERKMDLIHCFKSQFYNPGSTEPESPISTKEFLDNIKANAAVFGRLTNCKYGEGFTVIKPIGVNDLMELK